MTINLQPASPEVRIYPDGRLDGRNASAYLGLSEKTLACMRSTGDGPEFIKLGKRCFYQRETLDSWVQSRRATSTADARAKRRAGIAQ
jgi:hypothetical protein